MAAFVVGNAVLSLCQLQVAGHYEAACSADNILGIMSILLMA